MSGSLFQAGATVSFGGFAALAPVSSVDFSTIPAGSYAEVLELPGFTFYSQPLGGWVITQSFFTFGGNVIYEPTAVGSFNIAMGQRVTYITFPFALDTSPGGASLTLQAYDGGTLVGTTVVPATGGSSYAEGLVAYTPPAPFDHVVLSSTTQIAVGNIQVTRPGDTATSLSVSTPAHPAGAVDVVVTNPDSKTATLAGGFTFCAPPAIGAITVPAAVCTNSAGNQASVVNVGGVTYEWGIDGGTITAGQGTSAITFDAQYGGYDGYLHLFLIATNGCGRTFSTLAINVNAGGASLSVPPSVCPLSTANTASATAIAGASYGWSITNGTILSGNGTSSIVFSAGGSGSVDLMLTITNTGCGGGIANLSASVPIVAANASITAGGPLTFCSGGSVLLTANLGTAYQWFKDTILLSGETSGTCTAATSGSYTVQVTSSSGCVVTSAPVVVTANPPPVIPTVTPSRSTSLCAGESVTLTAPGGFSYLWSTAETTQSITVSTTGAYSVTVTDANGCSATSAGTAVVVNPLPPTPVITAGGPTTFCEGGSVMLSAPSGYSYLWSNSATTQWITVSAGGSYSVRITDANGCSATSAATTVTVNPLPATPIVTASGPTTFCIGGSVTLTAPTGFTYLWSNGATTQSISVSAAGNYSVTVTDGNGCSAASAATTVTVNPLPATPIVTASGPTTFCSGGSVTLTAPSGFTYLWSNSATTQSITVSAAGNYSVTITDGNGCSAASAATTVMVNPLPATPIVTASGPTTFCSGGSVTLTAPTGFTYLWSNSATTQSITVSAAGSYSVTVTDGNGCAALSAATTVTVNPLPATPIVTASGPTTFCSGGGVTLTAPAGFTYVWSTGATTQAITVSASGSYSVTITDGNGCSASSAPAVVNVNPLPVTPVVTAGGPTTFCAGASVTLTAPAGMAGYLWSNSSTNQSITVTTAGAYTVTITDANGCTATSAPTVVTVNAPPSIPVITASGPTAFCSGGSVTLTAPAGFAYLWSNSATTQSITVSTAGSYSVTVVDVNGCSATSAPTAVTVNALPPVPVITLSGPITFCSGGNVTLTAPAGFSYLWSTGATTQSITVSASGTYSVTTSNANGCAATSAPTTVTVNALPAAPVIAASGPTTFCSGGSVILTAPAGFSYLWSNSATTQSITVSAAGNYSVTIVDSNGCSAASAPTAVVVNPLPATPVITAGGPTTFCSGGSVTLTAPAGFSYLWSTGATTQSITVSTTGNYTVTVVDGNGCAATSSPMPVLANALPTTPVITPSGPTAFCIGGSVTLSAPSGYSYSWSTGDTTQAIVVRTSGTYSVTVRDANGCSTTSTPTVVTVNSLPAVPEITTSGPTTFCYGGSVTLSAPAASAYRWSNGATTREITVDAAGDYTVTITDANGCTAVSAPTKVFVSITPTPVIAASGPTTFCSGTSVTLSAPGGYSSYSWSNGATTQSIVVETSGMFKVTVTDQTCSATSEIVAVTVMPSPDATIAAPASLVAGTSGTASVPPGVAGRTYAWTVIGGTLTSDGSAASIQFTAGSGAEVLLKVVVTSGTCSSISTKIVPLTHLCADVAPTLQGPANGATLTSPVTFAWNAVTNAVTYELWLIIDGASAVSAGLTPGTSISAPVSGTNVEWYVSVNSGYGCTVQFSPHRALTVSSVAPCQSNTAPEISTPAEGAVVSSPVTFTWQGVTNASGYRVWVSVAGAAAQDMGTAAAGSTTLTIDVPQGNIEWYVEALFVGCTGQRSSSGHFVLPKPDTCANRAATTLLGPAAGSVAASSSIDFEWTAVSGASGYRVWGSVDGGGFNSLGNTTETKLTETISSGSVEWYVETLFAGCASVESTHRAFTVPKAQACSTAPAVPATPSSGTVLTNGNVMFTWSAAAGARSYELWLSLNDGTPTLVGTTTGTALMNEVASGSIQWFVRANFDGCPPADSYQSQFTYTPPPACSDDRPQLTYPLSGAIDLYSPVDFAWKEVTGAASYRLWVSIEGSAAVVKANVNTPRADNVSVSVGANEWYVEAIFPSCPPVLSTSSRFTVAAAPTGCATPPVPMLLAPASVSSNVQYSVRWQKVAGAASYQLQESRSSTLSDASTTATADDHVAFTHANTGSAADSFFYRVRAISNCNAQPSAYSNIVGVVILPEVASAEQVQGSTPVEDAQTIVYTIPLDASLAGLGFTAVPNQPWITVAPASGIVPAGGINLIATVQTSSLPVGTSIGGVTITTSVPPGASARVRTHGTTTTTTTLSVSLVQPVLPQPKDTPPPDALIIPAVAHADGINSRFQSDVRVTNTSPQVMKYQVTFVPSGDEGIKQGKQATIDVDPGRTVALDDVLGTWFSSGAFNSLVGALEIRPLTTVATSSSGAVVTGLANLVTFASSRTFNMASSGTFGQYIPAIPFANFVGGASDPAKASVLSLQQIAQSNAYRTNLGLVEGSGQAASVMVSVFRNDGTKLKDLPISLSGGQHMQLNSFLAQQGVQLEDGRVEVKVTSATGRVTAYASVLDNQTGDPLLVTPTAMTAAATNYRYVIPGVADLDNGLASWRSDVRVLNASSAPVDATLTFYSLSGGTPRTARITLGANELKSLDGVLGSLFGVRNEGGALHISTAAPSRLMATARTYNQTSQGTYGQFISAVTAQDATALGLRPLQILQVEESGRFRSNVGIAEVTGKPVKVQMTVISPDTKVTPVIEVDLAGNEFRQFNSLLKSMNVASPYNARVTVKVIGGEGRATAYASVIDAVTQDPTFVPAQ